MTDTKTEAAALAAAILTRHRIMCQVYGNHADDCQNCGTK